MGLQEMGQTARVEVTTKFVVTIATAILLVLGGRALALAWLWNAFAAFGVFLSLRAYRRVVPGRQVPTKYVGRALVTASFPFLLAEASFVIYQQVDTVIMSLLVNREAIGWYSTADVLFGSLLFVPVILMTSLFPALAEMHERDPNEIGPMLRRTFHSLLLVAVPIGIGTIVVSRSFVRLLYGPKFAKAGQVLLVYGIVVVLSSMNILLGRFALATDRVKFWTALMAGATVLTIPLDLVLVPWTDRHLQNGAVGGALAYVVTESVMMTIGVIVLAPHLFDRETGLRVLRCGIAGGAMFAAGWPLRDHLVFVPGSIAVVVYVGAIFAMRTINADERSKIDRMLRAGRAVLHRGRKSG
jgi:O-antigen/teichoic acid export membrane protein